MITRSTRRKFLETVLINLSVFPMLTRQAEGKSSFLNSPGRSIYLDCVLSCANNLIKYGVDSFGLVKKPILVSILDVENKTSPNNPLPYDENYRVIRRGRRNPAGANLIADQTLIRVLYFLSSVVSDDYYAKFASGYLAHYLENFVDENGLIWWGWHRHYDVFRDQLDGHEGNHHEIHANTSINWGRMWDVNPNVVRRQIEAIWHYHVIDKNSGEINRHGDGKNGLDFSMSAGAFIEAFAFLYDKTRDSVWLSRALLLAKYYWNRRNTSTNLFPESPNSGLHRFDGSAFVTTITGHHCHSLFKAWELTRHEAFRDYSVAYLKAYAKFGYDQVHGMFWGALNLDGSPIIGPRLEIATETEARAYEAYQPRGYLDLWQPYLLGYEHPIATAQAFIYGYSLTGESELLVAAERFVDWIERCPPGSLPPQDAWYKTYSDGIGRQGTYAGEYGRAISFLIHMWVITGNSRHLNLAKSLSNDAINKLFSNGLFKGHPAKPYYESVDGVGLLMYALLQLNGCLDAPSETLKSKMIWTGSGPSKLVMELDNW